MKVNALYQVFERVVAALVLLGMIAVCALATWSFLRTVIEVTLDVGGTLDYPRFQVLFDRVLAAVIAIELANSIMQMVAGKHGLVQLRTVVVIGMLAVVRKLILLEVESTSGLFLVGLAATIIALGGVLFLIHRIEPDGADVPVE